MQSKRPRYAPRQPRPSPYQVGRGLAATGSLKGLPYGPGGRQEAAIRGFREALARRQGGRKEAA